MGTSALNADPDQTADVIGSSAFNVGDSSVEDIGFNRQLRLDC